MKVLDKGVELNTKGLHFLKKVKNCKLCAPYDFVEDENCKLCAPYDFVEDEEDDEEENKCIVIFFF